MSVQVYGCNHVVIEVTDAKKAVKFYSDVFGLTMLRGGEGAAWCKLGEHQFMAIFVVVSLQPDRVKHLVSWSVLPGKSKRCAASSHRNINSRCTPIFAAISGTPGETAFK